LVDASPALVSVDWGTSSFRAYLVDRAGAILDALPEGKGALSLQAGEHEPHLTERLADWRAAHGKVPIIASGMVGARQGWLEAPYVACPAGAAEVAAASVIAPAPGLGGVRILPGVSYLDAKGAPDVMRGEETQILGALAAHGEDGVFVLPGTHSKWARVEAGRIVAFSTYMTGEVFAVLKTHSVLGRMMEGPSKGANGEGFARGLEAARGLEHPGDLLHAAFMARTYGLFGEMEGADLAEYLSGLLIGAEILSGALGETKAIVIATPTLTARYTTAGARLGVKLTPAPENCATLGQIEVARRLGMLPA
jgi:2-dehydro-3-deoxygalactonokinase